jgi:nucleotide-binding universal stress UspA family protein
VPKLYHDILLPIDVDDESSSSTAVLTATDLALQFGAQLHAMTVVPDVGVSMGAPFSSANANRRLIEHARERLDAVLREKVPSGLTVEQIVALGSVYREILRVARELPADLIVMGSHRPERADFLLGSNAAKVVRHAKCSVLVVRHDFAVSPWAVLP